MAKRRLPLARQLLDFLKGSEGNKLLEKYGYALPRGRSRKPAVNWNAVFTSLKLASLTSLILLFLGLPLASWLAFSRWRWKFLFESIVALPLVLPPTVLGFYVLTAMGPRSPLGYWYARLVGSPLPFTFEGLVVASVLYSLPFAVQPMASSFAGVDRNLVEVSWTLGVSRLATFFRLVLPSARNGVVTALGPDLCAYNGRVWRGSDGGREY